MSLDTAIETTERTFLPVDFSPKTWADIKPWFDQLEERDIKDRKAFLKWLSDASELEAVLEEDLGWKYVRMTCDTQNKSHQEAYQDHIENILPHMQPRWHALHKKLLEHPDAEALSNMEGYSIMFRAIREEVKLYREKNIPIETELNTLAQQYSGIMGKMSIKDGDEELTIPQAALKLRDTDRDVRRDTYLKIQERRLQEKSVVDALFNDLISRRTRLAWNAGFDNYRDYKFKAMGRFDYSVQDCFDFHDAIAQHITPLVDEMNQIRKENLGLNELRPWDLQVDEQGRKPLKPFKNGKDLLEKSIHCLNQVDPFFGDCLKKMNEMNHLDLESRKGKAPGGYNYPLYETGVPFIFMNAAGSQDDMITMIHEAGHAVHSFLNHDLPLTGFKSLPSEVAELASMSMELISMDYWDSFYGDFQSLNRAKKEHLERILYLLPWIATIDKFQHWLYANPEHTIEERQDIWIEINQELASSEVNWFGLDQFRRNAWQAQLHLFEVPFYYIEYGMAQLGAIAVWRNVMRKPKHGLHMFKEALKLGYTRTIPEIYEAAGIKFDFSAEYIAELAGFVREEYEKLT